MRLLGHAELEAVTGGAPRPVESPLKDGYETPKETMPAEDYPRHPGGSLPPVTVP